MLLVVFVRDILLPLPKEFHRLGWSWFCRTERRECCTMFGSVKGHNVPYCWKCSRSSAVIPETGTLRTLDIPSS